ncbi:MAG TPA: hypothetical protein VN457_02650 [Chlamydiales bacterium]|nr:hypothetical protein [Chlamydiales bacterium]
MVAAFDFNQHSYDISENAQGLMFQPAAQRKPISQVISDLSQRIHQLPKQTNDILLKKEIKQLKEYSAALEDYILKDPKGEGLPKLIEEALYLHLITTYFQASPDLARDMFSKDDFDWEHMTLEAQADFSLSKLKALGQDLIEYREACKDHPHTLAKDPLFQLLQKTFLQEIECLSIHPEINPDEAETAKKLLVLAEKLGKRFILVETDDSAGKPLLIFNSQAAKVLDKIQKASAKPPLEQLKATGAALTTLPLALIEKIPALKTALNTFLQQVQSLEVPREKAADLEKIREHAKDLGQELAICEKIVTGVPIMCVLQPVQSDPAQITATVAQITQLAEERNTSGKEYSLQDLKTLTNLFNQLPQEVILKELQVERSELLDELERTLLFNNSATTRPDLQFCFTAMQRFAPSRKLMPLVNLDSKDSIDLQDCNFGTMNRDNVKKILKDNPPGSWLISYTNIQWTIWKKEPGGTISEKPLTDKQMALVKEDSLEQLYEEVDVFRDKAITTTDWLRRCAQPTIQTQDQANQFLAEQATGSWCIWVDRERNAHVSRKKTDGEIEHTTLFRANVKSKSSSWQTASILSGLFDAKWIQNGRQLDPTLVQFDPLITAIPATIRAIHSPTIGSQEEATTLLEGESSGKWMVWSDKKNGQVYVSTKDMAEIIHTPLPGITSLSYKNEKSFLTALGGIRKNMLLIDVNLFKTN